MQTNEIIDGFKIRWLSSEPIDEVARLISSGEIDGIGLNPYRGWNGKASEAIEKCLTAKAIVIPFADRIGLKEGAIEQMTELKMLLLAEYSQNLSLNNPSLVVLRLMSKGAVSASKLNCLNTLYMREPTSKALDDILCAAPNTETIEINSGKLPNLAFLARAQGLKSLSLFNVKSIKDFGALSTCGKLEALTLDTVKNIDALVKTVSQLKSLRSLKIINCGALEDLEFLEGLNLTEFRCIRTNIHKKESAAIQRIVTAVIQ